MARGRSRPVGTSDGGRPQGSDAPRVALPETVLPRHHVDLYGTRLSFVDAGEGDPVVLLHGITCSAASWNRLLPALAEHHRVIAPDMPGPRLVLAGTRRPLDRRASRCTCATC